MNREKFEALSDVKEKLKTHKVVYDEELGKYRIGFNHDPLRVEAVVWLNGAYYAFCEHEKIIQMQECGVKAILEIIDSIVPYEYDLDTMSKINKIKEFLK